jgi:type IX secretion system PorP/SprF family membrane protein
MRKRILTAILMLFSGAAIYAQDASFSQYYGNPLYLNPAMAGMKICPRITLNYRNQWPSIPGTFVTYAASYDQYIEPVSGGIGIHVMSENMGDGAMHINSAGGLYSYRLELSRFLTLNAGFQATYTQFGLNWDKFIFEDQILSGAPVSREAKPQHLTVSLIDFSSGILFGYDQRIYGGVAVHHMNQPRIRFYDDSKNSQLDMKITVHAGALFGLQGNSRRIDVEDLSISPNIMYQRQGTFNQLNYGLYLNMYPFVFGGWYRHDIQNPDAVIALIGFQQPSFKIGYSYDYTVSGLTNATGGAHEVSFTWQLPCREKTFRIKAIKCPTF